MKKWLAYFELHVDDKTFPVYAIVEAENTDEVWEKIDAKASRGENHHLQAKGVLGEYTKELAEEYLDITELR